MHWFFPIGTRAAVSGRRNGDLRLRLSRDAEAWVPAAEARPLLPGGPAPSAVVGSLRITAAPDRATVRIPLSQRVPFRVEEGDRSLVAHALRCAGRRGLDALRPGRFAGAADDLAAGRADEVALTFELARPVWGYRTRWDRSDLLLDIRRPPVIDAADPFRGPAHRG